ncbi:hypothetical protein QQG74_28175 [Micromonospora sp. FIMYZ51]|uniref:hypothetical protein n=1 Tax=Micromonospora sp. FIMYZ51 TaxID=3051832 RepID=UPI00311FCEF0
METWRFLASGIASLAMTLVGAALALNVRGVTEWHVRRSMATTNLSRRRPVQHLARFVLLGRVIGTAFAAVGLTFLVVLSYTVLTDQPMRTVK